MSIHPLRLARLLCVALCLAWASPALASDVLDDGSLLADWQTRLDEGWRALHDAEERVTNTAVAYRKSRQRNYPRGEARDALLQDRETAEEELVEARRDWDELYESARRVGVPPGVLHAYERDDPEEP